MKRVSFKVAKALKDAGYKFTPATSSFSTNENNSWFYDNDGELYSLPYVTEVWLWLWREKKSLFDEGDCAVEIWQNRSFIRDFESKDDPEDALIIAIEHLVSNNLIK